MGTQVKDLTDQDGTATVSYRVVSDSGAATGIITISALFGLYFNFTGKADHDFLQYDSGTGKWVKYTASANVLSILGAANYAAVNSLLGLTYAVETEVDGHATDTLSAAECTNTVVHNVGQGAADCTLTLPAAAYGLRFMLMAGETSANYWRIRAAASDKIYHDGTAGADNGYVKNAGPSIGHFLAVRAFKTGAGTYDWLSESGEGTWVAE